MEEERFEIKVNQEDVQNIINCYEEDIKYIKRLEDRIAKAQEFIRNESYLTDAEIDELAMILEGDI